MKYLKEIISESVDFLTEGEGSNKKYYIQGCFMVGNSKNKNGRVYPTKTLAEATNKYIETMVNTNRALGELNHPDSVQVNPERASHRIVELWQEGDKIMGKALVLDTPMGKIVKALLDGGTQLGVSSRGFGSLKEVNGAKEVQEDFHIATVDIVSDPSAPGAFVSKILESKDFTVHNGIIVEVNEETEKAILEKHGCGCDLPLVESEDYKEKYNELLNHIHNHINFHKSESKRHRDIGDKHMNTRARGSMDRAKGEYKIANNHVQRVEVLHDVLRAHGHPSGFKKYDESVEISESVLLEKLEQFLKR